MSTSPFILAHDLGTTGNKATLFDAEGNLVSSAFSAYSTEYPRPNWAEQDPADWWQAVCMATRQLLRATGIQSDAIAAIGFSGQMMGCLPVDAGGVPLRSCIIWADQRAQRQAEYIAARCSTDEIYQRTGHRVSAAYTSAKILWVRDHQPQIYAQTAQFLQPKDYIVHRLTGQFVTDYSDASGTNLFDLAQRDWAAEFLQALELPRECLPNLHASKDVVGTVTTAAAQATGLSAGTPVVIGGGDGACASVGAGVIEPGEAYCYIGSSSWIMISSDRPILDPAQRTFTFHHLHPKYYSPTGTMQAAGGSRDWAWRVLDDPTLDEAVGEISPGAGGLIFLPYLLGERSPHWNPQARGAFVGLAMPHGRAEMARAVLEGVALNLRLILDAFKAQDTGITAMRLIGGGGKSPVWRQILADCFNLPIHVLSLVGEATSWGAAVAAGVGVGVYPDWSIASQRSQVVDVVEPIPENVVFYDKLASIFADTYTALEPIYGRLAKIQS